MRPTTKQDKTMKGTARPDRNKPLALAPLESVPKPPSYLSDPAAMAYHIFAGLLFDSGRLCQSDLFAVEGLAQAYADWRDACDLVDELGAAYPVERKSPDGTPRTEWKANPAVSIRNEADKRVRGWLQSCGLTPADRAKVSALTPAEDPADEWGDLLKQ